MNKLTYKYRFYILLGGIFIVSILTYKLAIKKTLELKAECSKIENELNSVGYAPQKISVLRKRLSEIEKLYGSDFEDLDKLQEKLLQHIGLTCKQYDLVLIELPEVHQYKNNDYVIKTFKVVVEGNYIDILKFVYDLEFKPALGRLASIKFYTQTNYRKNNKILYAQIIIQNIEL